MPKTDWIAVRNQFILGKTLDELVKQFKVSKRALEHHRTREHWVELRKRAQSLVIANTDALIASNPQELKGLLSDDLNASVEALRRIPVSPTLEHVNTRSSTLSTLVATASKLHGWDKDTSNSAGPVYGNVGSSSPIVDAEVIDVDEPESTKE